MKNNYMLHITHHTGAVPGMQPEYSMTCAASVNREPSGSWQAIHFPTWNDLATLLDSIHVGEEELRSAKKSLDEHRAYTMPEVWLEDYELTRLGFDAATVA